MQMVMGLSKQDEDLLDQQPSQQNNPKQKRDYGNKPINWFKQETEKNNTKTNMLSEFLRKNPKKGEQEIIIDEFNMKGFKKTKISLIKQCFWEIFNKRMDPTKKRKNWGSISQLNDSLQAGINRCASLGVFSV